MIKDSRLKEEQRRIIEFKMLRILEKAEYFVVDDVKQKDWHHFALNFECYTHFTSPIRRYPDILVHRLLIKGLKYGEDARTHVNKE